jgi:hypothetical protein
MIGFSLNDIYAVKDNKYSIIVNATAGAQAFFMDQENGP